MEETKVLSLGEKKVETAQIIKWAVEMLKGNPEPEKHISRIIRQLVMAVETDLYRDDMMLGKIKSMEGETKIPWIIL
ncbi:hypothetical protein J7J84_02940 [bacterium]|nr:hypothetical protein [bacterium]